MDFLSQIFHTTSHQSQGGTDYPSSSHFTNTERGPNANNKQKIAYLHKLRLGSMLLKGKVGFIWERRLHLLDSFLGCNKLILLVFKNSNLPKYSNMKIGLYLKNNYKWNMTAWHKKKNFTFELYFQILIWEKTYTSKWL